MSVRARVDLSGLERRFSDAALRAKQAAFARRVAFEARDYVPEDQGTLKGSEPLSSDYEAGSIEWQTPYAERVYDLPPSSVRKVSGTGKSNPKATSRWAEAAKRDRLGAWRGFAERIMEER